MEFEETSNNVYMEDEIGPDYNFKIIVVGNKNVGKTSITSRFVHDEFNENS